jgi:type II secretory pathway component PulF
MVITLWIAYLHTLYMLISSGVDLLSAHQLMAKQDRFKRIQDQLWNICQSLTEGQRYYVALRYCHPPPLIAVYLQFGEVTGQLDATLLGLRDWLRRQHQFKRQCIQALTYPCMIFSISALLILGMIFWILPQLMTLYVQLNAPIPRYISQIVDTITVPHCTVFICMLGVLGMSLNMSWRAGAYLRLPLERCLFNTPLLGKIVWASRLSQNCELLTMAYRCGIPLAQALALLSQYGDYKLERQAWGSVHTQILGGRSLSEAMKLTTYFDPSFIELIDVGEKTGKLDEQFQHCAIYYTEHLLDTMSRFKEAIQPSMMLVLGLILGGWVILLYYPIVQLGYLVG